VEPEVAERLAQRLAASGVTESGLQRSSVLEYLDEMSDRILILRRLDRMGRAMERLQRELEFVAEGAAVFYLTWFCNTGAVPADQAGPAATSGEARYRRFMELVARRFACAASEAPASKATVARKKRLAKEQCPTGRFKGERTFRYDPASAIGNLCPPRG
jgi:hypothetical protein